MRIVPVVCLTVLLAAAPASAQVGLFSQGGFGGFLNFQTGDDITDFGIEPSFVVNPMFEAALGLSRSSCDGCDASTYVTPKVFFYPLRQSETMPVTVYGTAHYHFIFLEDAPDGYSSSGWGVGVGAARQFAATPTINVTPIVQLTYTGFTSEYEMGGVSMSYDSNPFYYSIVVLGSMEAGPGTLFFGPLFEGYSEDGSSGSQVGFRVGIALNKK